VLHPLGGNNKNIVHFAFYAMLYAVFAVLVPHQVEKGVDKDGETIAFFDDKFVKTNMVSREASRKIHDAFELRQAIDFQPLLAMTREQAIKTLNSSEEFIKIIEEKLIDIQ
jgi:uncharacterized protein (UPF0332 family)